MIEELKKVIERTVSCRPMTHCITNPVTVNDCANIILAAGGTAIMAQDEREVEEITAHASSLVLNMGAVRAQEAMLRAAATAKKLGPPVVLDPVAAGASHLRGDMCAKLLAEGFVSVIRGNVSEIRALAGGTEQESGVEADLSDRIDEDNLAESAAWLRDFAHRTGTVVLLTGAMDVITDGNAPQCCAAAVSCSAASPGQGVCSPRLPACTAALHPIDYLKPQSRHRR